MASDGQTNLGMEVDDSPPPPSKHLTTGYNISWTNLGYTVQDGKNGEKEILSGLNGIVYPGSVVAVLGASGAGKTSFLDVLAGRKVHANVTGTVKVNGSTDIPIRHVSRYCVQVEALFGNLTVYDTLMYAADFNLPKSTPKREKAEIVKDLLEKFGLTDVKNTIIGTPLRKGCSGGEIRRVSVASQVVGMKEGILFLDEPTSGLDSVAASAVVTSLCNLATKQNIAIIATIHQPSTETFDLFSHLLVLGQGKMVYFGKTEEAIDYFESIDYPLPMHANPADCYLQLTNVDFSIDREEGKVRVAELAESFAKSDQLKTLMAEIEENENFPPERKKGSNPGYTNGFVYQTTILASRAFLNAFKNPLSYWIRVAMYVALAILMGTTWFQMGNAQTTAGDRLAGLLFAVCFLAFMAVAGIPAFLEERLVFTRERANGLYGVESYVLSNFLVSIPFMFIIALAFSGIAYFSMGLQETSEKFCTFVTVLFITLMIAEAQTVFVSVLIPIFVAALAVTAFANGLWMVVQGFFVQKKNIPPFWRYSFHQIDFQRYAYELLVSNEMSGLTFSCKDPASGSCACIYPVKNTTKACEVTGEDVLRFFDYAEIDYTKWMVILFAIFMVFKIGTLIVLKIQTRDQGQLKEGKNNGNTANYKRPGKGVSSVPNQLRRSSNVALHIPKVTLPEDGKPENLV